jgi:hypothetical protein
MAASNTPVSSPKVLEGDAMSTRMIQVASILLVAGVLLGGMIILEPASSILGLQSS